MRSPLAAIPKSPTVKCIKLVANNQVYNQSPAKKQGEKLNLVAEILVFRLYLANEKSLVQ